MWQNTVSQQPGKTRKGKEGGEERDTSRQRALPAGEFGRESLPNKELGRRRRRVFGAMGQKSLGVTSGFFFLLSFFLSVSQ